MGESGSASESRLFPITYCRSFQTSSDPSHHMSQDAFMAGLVQEYILGKTCRQITAARHGDRAVRTRRRRARPSRNLLVAGE